jgi:hypothetical protein
MVSSDRWIYLSKKLSPFETLRDFRACRDSDEATQIV